MSTQSTSVRQNMPPDETLQPENTPENTRQTLPPEMEARKWQPGQSGNPGGRPKKKPVTDLFEELMSDPELVAGFKSAIARSIMKGGMAGVMYMKEAADRLEGKVTQPIDAEVHMHSLSERMQKAQERIKE